MATIYEVSELAGVSLATVSRVMNKNARVSEKTEKKVKDAMLALDYRPNSIARSLASSRSSSVGVLVSEVYGPFFGAMMRGIEAELRVSGIHVIIAAGHSEESTEKDGIEFLIDRSCDALILHVEALSDEYLLELSKGSVPFVLINRKIQSIESNCIYLNNELGGYLATRSVLDFGHQQVAYISGPLWKKDSQARFAGHKRAMAEQGLSVNAVLSYEGDFQGASGVSGLRHLLSLKTAFTAVVCANDEMASGAMEEARDQGLNVPKDISVQGFDNDDFSEYMFPKLSTVDYPVHEMGINAARWVLKNVYQKQTPDVQNVFHPFLVGRDSVKNI
jgi:LacI family transcriptional regulator